MTDQKHQVDNFVSAVRRRLNAHRRWNSILWAAVLGVTVVVVIGLTYVLRGYAVSPMWYGIVGSLSVLVAIGVWLATRADAEVAARYADDFYRLQDSLVSYTHFERAGKTGGFYDLQAAQTASRVSGLAPSEIKYQTPRRAVVGLLVLGIVALVLGFQDTSEAVQQRIAQEKQTLDETDQVNKELEELINELEEEIKGTDEEELIDPSELRKWVEELKETTDQKEALRQYARLEKKIQEASVRLEDKRDEQLLQRAAKELKKDRETKELAKNLKQKKYDDAAKEVKKMRSLRKKSLSEQRKELARMKAAAHRMSTASKSLKSGSKDNDQRRLNRNKPSDGKQLNRLSKSSSGKKSDSDLQDATQLEEAIEDLEDSIEEWEEALSKAELEELDESQLEECEACRGGANEDLEKLAKKLRRMGAKMKARKRMAKLSRACSQCQSGLCRSGGRGGKKAGEGSDPTRREERDETIDNGQYAKIKGIKGKGPSLTKVEAAETGTGVSNRRHKATARTFERQVESFVQREDVPENVRAGVKEYFQNIHQVGEDGLSGDGLSGDGAKSDVTTGDTTAGAGATSEASGGNASTSDAD